MASSKDSVPPRLHPLAPGAAEAEHPIAFALPLLHGICVGVYISDNVARAPDDGLERAPEAPGSAPGTQSLRDRHFAAGRLALRAALSRLGVAADRMGELGTSARGAPVTPPGTTGSVSHKPGLAVGLAAWRAAGPEDGREDWIVGVDIEARTPTRRDISRRVLGADERARLEPLPEAERALAVILHFSIKEAIYKAIDPFVQRYVGFTEVGLAAHPDGRVEVRPALDPPADPALDIQACWTTSHGFYLCAARARPAVHAAR